MQQRRLGTLVMTCLVVLATAFPRPAQAAPEPTPPDVMERLQQIYLVRSQALTTGADPKVVEQFYDLSAKTAQWALQHEHGRLKYMHTWAQNRGLKITDAEPRLKVTLLGKRQGGLRFYIAQSLRLAYVYPQAPVVPGPDRSQNPIQSPQTGQAPAPQPGQTPSPNSGTAPSPNQTPPARPNQSPPSQAQQPPAPGQPQEAAPERHLRGPAPVQEFGVGTRHIIDLTLKDGKWLIKMEWYTDPLGDDTEVPDVSPAAQVVPAWNTRYDRAGAVDYADKFCGLAWGCGNNNRYNPQYTDYNGVGGDCTNFISQAISSKDGGKLSLGIQTRTYGLYSSVVHSGRGHLAGKGTYQQIARSRPGQPFGAAGSLQPGDLIAYEEKGKIEHFAIVTAKDSRGYPLVNAHTADRYRCPFDVGWDRKTIYYLIKMH